MKRREFITLLGGAAAWPLAARAQQTEPDAANWDAHGLYLGRSGRTGPPLGVRTGAAAIRLDRWPQCADRNPLGAGDAERYRRYAAELIALAPDVILVGGGSILAAVQNATRTVPIVFVSVTDPVGAGYVASLARPGANTTGFTLFEYGTSGKWLELLKADRARRDASGGHSRPLHNFRSRPVGRNPGGGTVIRGGVDAGRCARR